MTLLRLKNALAFCKRHIKAILLTLALSALAIYMFFKRRGSPLADIIRKIDDAHTAENATIDKTRADEAAAHAKHAEELHHKLDDIHAQYDDAQHALDVAKRAEIDVLLKRTNDDLADALSHTTGIKVIKTL